MLKSWAVKRLAAALSDYLEGFTSEGVQASLGRDVGELDLSARINPAAPALRSLNLAVVRSEVQLKVRIPWRQLSSEPTELGVHRLRLELQMQPSSNSKLPEVIAAHRTEKEAAVKCLEEQLNRIADGKSVSRFARISHAVLRQLQVSAQDLQVLVQREVSAGSQEPLRVEIQSARLENASSSSMQSGVLSDENEESQDDLRKVLGLSGYSVWIGESSTPILGPLAVDTRLWHVPSQALFRLQMKFHADDPVALTVNTKSLHYLRGCLTWCLSVQPGKGSRLPEHVGRAYAALYLRLLRDEPYDEARLRDIEEAATARWIVGWREWCRMQAVPVKQPAAQPQEARSFWQRMTGVRTVPERPFAAESSDSTVDDLLDAAGDAGLLPELEAPTRVLLAVSVPRCEAKCAGSDQSIELAAGGAECSVQVCAVPAAGAQSSSDKELLWQVSTCVEFQSLTLRIDDAERPLLQLCELRGEGTRPRPVAEDHILAALKHHDTSPLWLEVMAQQQEAGAAGGSQGWDVVVTLRKESSNMYLAPWSIQGFVTTLLEAARALRSGAAAMEQDSHPAHAFEAEPFPTVDETALDVESSTRQVLDKKKFTIRCDVMVGAPILHLQAPRGSAELEVHVGVFHALTCSAESGAAMMGDDVDPQRLAAEAVTIDSFSCACMLRETSVALVEQSSKRELQEHETMLGLTSTVMLHWRRKNSQVLVDVHAPGAKFHFTPELLNIFGQLKLGLEFAFSPLVAPRHTSVSQDGIVAKAQSMFPEPATPTSEKESSGCTHMQIQVGTCEVTWSASPGRRPIVARFQSMNAKRTLKDTGFLLHCSLTHLILESDKHLLIECSQPLLFNIETQTSPLQVVVQATAPPILAQWAAAPVQATLLAAMAACKHFADGERLAMQLLPVGPLEGMSRRLWNRYMDERMKRIRGQVWQRACDLGVSKPSEEEEAGGECDRSPHTSMQALSLILCCAGMSLVVQPGPGAVATQPVKAGISNLQCSLHWQAAGGAQVEASLGSMNLTLGERHILMRRHAADELLHLSAQAQSALAKGVVVKVSWAQIALVYRQRDFDALKNVVRQEVVSALSVALETHMASESEAAATEARPAETASAMSPESGTRSVKFKYEYELSVAAPLVFLPTDHSAASAHLGVASGGSLTQGAAESHFESSPGDGFAIIDFGDFNISGSSNIQAVDVMLRQMHIHSALVGSSCESSWEEVVCPLGLRVAVDVQQERIDVKASSPVDDHSTTQHLRLSRAHVTQWLDILLLNINYAAQSTPPPAPGQAALITSTNRRKEFHLTLTWQGPLSVDVEFTRDSPLASLRLSDGTLQFRSVQEGFYTTLRCSSIRAEDCRREAQNIDKTFFDSISSDPGAAGLDVRVFAPPNGTDGTGRVDVDVARPTLYVLPMLVQDISIWFLSTYQQSAMGMQPMTDVVSGAPVNPTPFAVAVSIPHAAVRVVTQWKSPEEYFEIAGGVFVSVTVRASYVRIDKVLVSGGVLHRGSAGASPGLLCRKFECCASGSFENMDDMENSIRSKALSIETLTIRPLCIRLSVLDQRLLLKSIASLMQYEANSAEPADELWGRDPLSLAFQVSLATAASLEVEGIELQLLDDSKSQGARPAVEVSFVCPLLVLDMVTARGQPPRGVLRLDHFIVGMRSHNERLGQWEPVLANSMWNLECNIHAGSAQAHGEAVAEMRLTPSETPSKPVSLAITVPFIHQVARLLPQLNSPGTKSKKTCYGDMLVGVNLSGLDCIVSRRAGGEEVCLNSTGAATPLDALIVDVDDTSALPPLVLQFIGIEGAPCHEVSLAAEGSTIWHNDTSSVLIRVSMPQPPQRVLLVSSTVLVTNKTPSDIEIRFLRFFESAPGNWLSMEGPPCWVPAKVLDASVSSQAEVQCMDPEEERSLRKKSDGDEHIRIPSNCVLGVPFIAIQNAGAAFFQVRPAQSATGGIEYKWGKCISTASLNQEEDGTTSHSACSEDAFDLPPHQLHLQRSGLGRYAPHEAKRDWIEVCIDAPFRLANACPCEIHICLWDATRTSTYLGEEHDQCDSKETLEVLDGNGGAWGVQPDGHLDIYPIHLDGDGWFYWYAGKDRERTRPRWRQTNLVQVERRGRRITWRCLHMGGSIPSRAEQCQASFCLGPQQELPVFDVPANRTYFSVALRDRRTRRMTGWSLPLPVAVPAQAPLEARIRLDCSGTSVQLGARRQRRRRTTVFARTWFVDATGLDACLVQEDGTHLPVFGDSISLPGEEETALLGLPGEDSVQVTVPNLGSSTKVELSPVHDCVLQVEPISSDSTFGVVCNLLSLVPALMVFSQVDACEIGFRQSRCTETIWLSPGESSCLYWTRADCPRQVQVAVRPLGSGGKTDEVDSDFFSIPFQIAERGIGAYPRVLMQTLSLRRLVCIQVDQSGQLFTITASGESKCHQLVNRHPCLVLDASFEGDDHDSFAHFVVPCGQQAAIGRSASSKSRSDRLVLILGDVFQGNRSWRVTVDLDRTGTIQVNQKDSLRAAAVVRVELRARVARVTVDPLVIKGSAAEVKYAIHVNLRLPQLSFLVVSEEPRSEILAGTLQGLSLVCKQSSGLRETEFELANFQVDLRARTNKVILASVGKRFLHVSLLREDLHARNVKIRRATVSLGRLEVTLDETLLKTLKKFAQVAIPRALGLEMDTVLSRAGVPYNLSCGGPPVASRKYELRSIRVSEAKCNVWCHLSVARFPDIVQFFMNFSLSNTLEVNGASLKLQEQTFFEGDIAFEGSVEALGSQMWQRYKPNVISSWRSLLMNSNTVLGGIFSRNMWDPKQRSMTRACRVPLRMQFGRVVVQDDHVEKKPLKLMASASASVGTTAALDQIGYARVMAARSNADVEVFIRRVLGMLGCQVVDDSGLSDFVAEYMEEAPEGQEDGFASLVESLTVSDISWAQPVDSSSSSARQPESGGYPPHGPQGDVSSSDSLGADTCEDLARGGFIEFA